MEYGVNSLKVCDAQQQHRMTVVNDLPRAPLAGTPNARPPEWGAVTRHLLVCAVVRSDM